MSGITWRKKNIPMKNKITIRNHIFPLGYLGNFSGYPTDTISVTSALNETSGLNGLIHYVAIFGNDTTR